MMDGTKSMLGNGAKVGLELRLVRMHIKCTTFCGLHYTVVCLQKLKTKHFDITFHIKGGINI